MPRLILINGLPGIGKSTLARLYAQRHPLTLALDIDVLKAMLGGWLERANEAGLIARHLAIAAARVQLQAGRDVVVPQFVARIDFVVALEQLAHESNATFVEVMLTADVPDVIQRFERRSAHPEDVTHVHAAQLLAQGGGVEQLWDAQRLLAELAASRPRTVSIPSTDTQIEQTYAQLEAVLQ